MNYTFCKECGDPCHSKVHICAQCEEESSQASIRKYEEKRYSFSRYDIVGKQNHKEKEFA